MKRDLALALIFGLLTVSFQNCAPSATSFSAEEASSQATPQSRAILPYSQGASKNICFVKTLDYPLGNGTTAAQGTTTLEQCVEIGRTTRSLNPSQGSVAVYYFHASYFGRAPSDEQTILTLESQIIGSNGYVLLIQ